jgi:hypothetical protein
MRATKKLLLPYWRRAWRGKDFPHVAEAAFREMPSARWRELLESAAWLLR